MYIFKPVLTSRRCHCTILWDCPYGCHYLGVLGIRWRKLSAKKGGIWWGRVVVSNRLRRGAWWTRYSISIMNVCRGRTSKIMFLADCTQYCTYGYIGYSIPQVYLKEYILGCSDINTNTWMAEKFESNTCLKKEVFVFWTIPVICSHTKFAKVLPRMVIFLKFNRGIKAEYIFFYLKTDNKVTKTSTKKSYLLQNNLW
jgi:hypothetical protein